MPQVSHHFVVDRPIDAVFDVVTTARFWTEWHPATRGVEGDVDHPARLGDRIIEHVTIAGIEGSGTWTVVEYDRPHRLALETDLAVGHLRIGYQLAAVDGGTRFQRDLDFPELGPQVGAAMEAQSAEGISSLGRLVQRMVPPPGAATIEELIARMQDMQARLDASGDASGESARWRALEAGLIFAGRPGVAAMAGRVLTAAHDKVAELPPESRSPRCRCHRRVLRSNSGL